MKRCVVVTEGPSDEILIRHLLRLENSDPHIKVVAAGGWSAADSLARSFLARGSGDVALIVDADATDEPLVEERRHFLEGSLAAIASAGRFRVVVVAPELEAVLFQDPDVLEAIVRRPVSPSDLIRGHYEPKKVLLDLLGGVSRTEAFKERLPSLNLDRIRDHPAIQELSGFVQQSLARAVAA